MAKTDKAVVKAGSTALAATEEQLAALAAAGAEFDEPMGQDDMSVPFLTILQALSPQCTRGDDDFIKGAEPSEVFNTLTRERYATQDDDNNPVIGGTLFPVTYKRSFIEWVTRANGGGFVEEYDVPVGVTAVTRRNDANQDIIQQGSPIGTPGNQLNATHTHICLMVTDHGVEPVVLTMTATQLKPSRDWNALIDKMRKAGIPGVEGSKAPRFFKAWDFTTRTRSNDQGSWFVWDFRPTDRFITEIPGAIDEAIAFSKSVAEGEVKVDHNKSAENPSVNNGGGAAPDGGADDEEVPF